MRPDPEAMLTHVLLGMLAGRAVGLTTSVAPLYAPIPAVSRASPLQMASVPATFYFTSVLRTFGPTAIPEDHYESVCWNVVFILFQMRCT